MAIFRLKINVPNWFGLNVRKPMNLQLDGFVGPGHVSMVIGTEPYQVIAQEYHKPVVVWVCARVCFTVFIFSVDICF